MIQKKPTGILRSVFFVSLKTHFKPPRSEEGSLRGLKSRARCAGFSVMEIGNRKERVRDYASFPDDSPSGRF